MASTDRAGAIFGDEAVSLARIHERCLEPLDRQNPCMGPAAKTANQEEHAPIPPGPRSHGGKLGELTLQDSLNIAPLAAPLGVR